MKNSKVLVITSWSPPMVGGPQNLYNLFSQFPPDSYTILTGYRSIQATSGARGTWLAGDYIFYDYKGPVQKTDIPKQNPPSPQARSSSLYDLLARIHRLPLVGPIIYSLLTLSKLILMTRAGIQEVKKRPYDLILGISDHGPALLATYLVARFTHTPYALYLYDIYKGNNLFALDNYFAHRFEKLVWQAAKCIIVTNEGTEQFYQHRYGKSVNLAVVHNSVFAKPYEKQRKPYRPKSPYTILFTGNVYWAQEQSLLNLFKAMDQLKSYPVRLDCYIPKMTEAIHKEALKRKNIRLLSAPQSEMPKIQSQATLLFLPLAWDTKSPDIIATATPGKFTDYLASGKPMLVHAPSYAYVSQYTKKHQLGLVVDENNHDLLAKTIRSFLDEPNKGQLYIKNALAVFNRNHDAIKNAKKLILILKK